MIQANELKIGNYIQSGKGIYNVISISHYKDSTDIITVANDGVVIPYPCIYKGIPITEEWLLKFGFEQNGILQLKFDEYSKGFITLGKVVSGEELYQLIYDGKCFLTFLQYVHHLQNLYFALTQTELTCK